MPRAVSGMIRLPRRDCWPRLAFIAAKKLASWALRLRCCVDQSSVEEHHCRSGDVWTLLACFSDDMVNSPSHHHRQLSIILKSNWMLRSEKWGNGICWSWPRSLGSAAVTQNNHICPLMGIELPSTDQKRITRHRMAVRSQSSLPQLNELAEYIRNIAVYSTSCSLYDMLVSQ